MEKYTAEDLAELLNLTKRRVYQLVKEKILQKDSRGKYELKPSLQAYIRYLQDIALEKNNSPEQRDSKDRLLQAKAEKAELELEVLKGKYLEKKEVDFTWENLMLYFRSRILAMPSKLAPTIVTACSDKSYSAGCHKVHDILEEELRQALLELSKTEYDDIAPDEDITSEEPAATDGEVTDEDES